MENITIKYKLTIYDNDNNIKIIDNLIDNYDSNELFPNMIDSIVNKNKISNFQIYVEDLKNNTWGKILGEELASYCAGDDYHYKWCNYKISDIQKTFNLFDKKINIVINGPGIGILLDKKEGIRFIINNNEKDRHEFEPHVHCTYSNEEMRIRIDTLQIMKKDKEFKNKRKVKIAKDWIRKNQKALLKYYNSFAINGDSNIPLDILI